MSSNLRAEMIESLEKKISKENIIVVTVKEKRAVLNNVRGFS